MNSVNGQSGDRGVSASIVIVNYNGGNAILDCLESVEKHTKRDVEVLVVDNASADGSPNSIRVRFPGVQLIEAGANLGFGAGNNLGVRHTRGEFVAFLNPDTVVTEGWLDVLIDVLERFGGSNYSEAAGAQARSLPYMDSTKSQYQADGLASEGNRASTSAKQDSVERRVGMVTSKILMADDPDTINTCGNSVHLTGITLCRGLGEPRESMSRMENVSAASGAALAMGKDLFEEIGGFDEDMFLYMEDTDLSLRVRIAGYECLHVPSSIVLHSYLLKLTPMKVFYQERNRYLMLLKNLRWPTLFALLPALSCAEV